MKNVNMRFRDSDLAAVDAIRGRMGLQSITEIIRWALRKAADAEGIELPAPAQSGPGEEPTGTDG